MHHFAQGMKVLLILFTALCVLFESSQSLLAQLWNLTVTPIDGWAAVACSANGSNLIAAGYLGNAYTSPDRGATWKLTSLTIDEYAYMTSVASSADGVKLVAAAGGSGGAIYTSTNSGTSWTQTSAPTNGSFNDYRAVASSPDGFKLIAVSAPKAAFTSLDGGKTWNTNYILEPTDEPQTVLLSAAISADGTKMVVGQTGFGYASVGPSANYSYGQLDYSLNSGVTWETSDAPTSFEWNAVACSTNGNFMVAVGYTLTNTDDTGDFQNLSASDIYVSTNSGVNWKPAGELPLLPWACVTCSADGSKITVSAVNSYDLDTGDYDFSNIGAGDTYSSTNFGVNWVPNHMWDTNGSWYLNPSIYHGGPLNPVYLTAIASSADGSKLVGTGFVDVQDVEDEGDFVLINPPLSSGSKPPNLVIKFIPPQTVKVFWPVGGYTLQQNLNLATTNWQTNTNPITTVNNTNSITISPPKGNLFFRLSSP
jgi:photosystem II stability/assembly factor-like uncharacterized protein